MKELIIRCSNNGFFVEVVGEIVRCKDCKFSSTYSYKGELNWTCNNAEDGLNRDVSENSYCSSAIERKEDE